MEFQNGKKTRNSKLEQKVKINHYLEKIYVFEIFLQTDTLNFLKSTPSPNIVVINYGLI